MKAAAINAGSACVRLLANASVTVGAETLFGILTDIPDELVAGDGRAMAHRKVFRCLKADADQLAQPLKARSAVTMAGQTWRVQGEPMAHRQVGWLSIELERP